MKRRTFLQQTVAVSLVAQIPSYGGTLTTSLKEKKITILHTNDVHSHIDSFENNHPKFPNRGGVSRRASLIAKIRSEEENVLLLDAGDIFQGTPYFNYYGGELEFKLMSKMGYDLATLGNHDFDNGIDGFYKQLPHARFDFVSANYNFKNTILDTHVKPYKIFNKNGLKIGVFGLGVELKGLVDKKLYKETEYLNPVEVASDIVKELKYDKKCDLIICLSHLGYNYKNEPTKVCDLILAKETENIDLIIGGHSHTFLEEPTVVKNKNGTNVLVNQVGCFGVNLGRIDFFLSNNKKEYLSNKIAVG